MAYLFIAFASAVIVVLMIYSINKHYEVKDLSKVIDEQEQEIADLEHKLKTEKAYSASLVKIAVPVKADLTKTEII